MEMLAAVVFVLGVLAAVEWIEMKPRRRKGSAFVSRPTSYYDKDLDAEMVWDEKKREWTTVFSGDASRVIRELNEIYQRKSDASG